jgi:hypothetical protein
MRPHKRLAWPPQTPQARAAMFARLSASRPPAQVITAFSGGPDAHTMLSPPSVHHALLGFLTTAAALPLRAACADCRAVVAGKAWEDSCTLIKGSIAAWRACFPRARCANVRQWKPYWDTERVRRTPVLDADFVYFEGLRDLNMGGCRAVTDAAFVHLRGIHTLDMSLCYQPTITNAAFAHLVGIQRLSIWCCGQATLTDAAFVHLRGIQLLNMSECHQFTDAAFVHLRGIHTLYMWNCLQHAISDAAFVHLRGIHTLVIEGCSQATLTGAGLAHLQGIRALGMYDSRAALVAAGCSLGLPVRTLPVRTLQVTSIGALHYA